MAEGAEEEEAEAGAPQEEAGGEGLGWVGPT